MNNVKSTKTQGSQYDDDLGETDINHILGYIERGYTTDNDRLIIIMNTPLSHDDIMNKLSKEDILLIRSNKQDNELLIKVNGIEKLIPMPPLIPGGEKTRLKLITKALILRIPSNNGYKYVKGVMIPIMNDIVLEPKPETIKEFLNLGNNVILGHTLIDGYRVPIAINDDQLTGGLLIVGEPGSGKTKIIMNIIKSSLNFKVHENIVIIDRTGEYLSNIIKMPTEFTDSVVIYMPIDLAKLERALDIDEVIRYVLDELKIAGLKGKVKIRLFLIHENGIKLIIKSPNLELTVYPISIKSRWFLEELANMNIPSSDVSYLILNILHKSKNNISTIQDFINAIQGKELPTDIRKSTINKTLNLLMKLKQSGYFDTIANVNDKSIKLTLPSPVGALNNRLVIYDIHRMSMELMNMYNVLLLNNVIMWFLNESRKSLIVMDNLEGLITTKNLLNAIINIIRNKDRNTSVVMASRTFNRTIYHEVNNIVLTRVLGKFTYLNECVGTPMSNKHFILISPAINIDCVAGSAEE